mmetsp:Transcript_20132/g.50677  ORF Transcript_20132/g.50677 Transcript_20132/m.50677 type:complete len:223 (+) Transcript_20132:372-1040(+)
MPRSMDELVAALHGADAVVCCVGFRPTYIPQDDRRLAQEIDNFGICKLVDAAVQAGVSRFVLVSSLLTNASQDDPSYRALNMLGGVLEAKRANENHLLASPLAPSSTIVRPGVFAAVPQGALRLAPEDTITSTSGLAVNPTDQRRSEQDAARCSSPLAAGSSRGGSLCAVTRSQVAEVCVSALFSPAACGATVEMFAVAGGAAVDTAILWTNVIGNAEVVVQ